MLESPPRETLIQRLARTLADAAASVMRAVRRLFAGDAHVRQYREKLRTAPKPAVLQTPVPPPGPDSGTTLTAASARKKRAPSGDAAVASAEAGETKSAAESDPDFAPSRNDAREESGPAAEPQTGRGGASSASAGPPQPEPVLLGGSAPRRARPGDVILAQFAAYVARFEEVARRALEREAAPGEVRLGEETDCRWAVGTRVTVRCTARGLNVFTPVQSFVWDGDCRTLSFDIEVPADARPRDTVILFEAFVHDADEAPDAVQVGRLRMSLEIGDKADDQPPRPVHGQAARTAFASYASEDRIDVLERVSSIRRSAGLEVFVDVVSLRMGDEWNPELDRHIRESDRFLLFWSGNTPKSKWVTWERQKAVELHGEDVLELHLLRYTPIDQVPVDLRRYHFNDIYIIARDAELHRRAEAGKETPQT